MEAGGAQRERPGRPGSALGAHVIRNATCRFVALCVPSIDNDGASRRLLLTTTVPASQRAFAALHHPGYRIYFVTNALAMMADSIEHVISYWMMHEKFASPALARLRGHLALGAVPAVLGLVGRARRPLRSAPADPDRHGCCSSVASVGWAYFLITDTLQMWHAMVLLVLHGFAGVFWAPPSQVLIHDIVGTELLQSAVRLNATARWLGLLAGPAVGAGFLLVLGPVWGLVVNALFYLPLLVWLWKAPYGPKFRKGVPAPPRAVRGLADIVQTIRDISGNRTVASMTLLAGGASLFIGNAYQAQMPEFASDLGHVHADFSYSALLAADAAGALLAGVLLESRGLLQPKVAHGVHAGDAVVRRHRRLRARQPVSARAGAAVRGRLRRTGLLRDGADAGAAATRRRRSAAA